MADRRTLVFAVLAVTVLFGCSKTPEEKAAIHKERAAAFLQQSKADEALIELRGALSFFPDDIEALLQVGSALLEKRQHAEAFRTFSRVAELDAENVEAHLHLGRLLLLANSPMEAREHALKVLAAAPERADAQSVLAQAYLKERRDVEAFVAFDRAIELARENPEHRVTKATALVARDRLEEARTLLDSILTEAPDHAPGLLLLAQVAHRQKDGAGVDVAFERLLLARPENPGVWLSYGALWLDRGDTEKALAAFEKAGEVDKRGTSGWERYAEVSLERGDRERARKALSEIYRKNPKSLVGTFFEGWILLGENRTEEAKSKFLAVLGQEPDHVQTHYLLGTAHAVSGALQLARTSLERALQLDAGHYKARLLLSEVHLSARNFDLVLQTTDSLLAREKIHPQAVVIRARALMAKGRVAEARSLLEGLVRAAPKYPGAQTQLGIAYVGEKRFEEALDAFSRALELDPKDLVPLVLSVQVLASDRKVDAAIANVLAHIQGGGDSATARLLLAELYQSQGDRARAREEAERALELDPDHPSAYTKLAQLESGPDAVRAAIAQFDAALGRQPGYFRGWVVKGTLHNLIGEAKQAEEAYRRALVLRPDSVAVLNNLALHLVESGGNVDEALKYAARAVELAPNLPEANDTLGWIYAKKGAWLKAVSHLEPAAQVLRSNPSVFYHLGEAYAGLGENRKAVEALSRAVSLAEEFPGSDAARSTLERLKTMPK